MVMQILRTATPNHPPPALEPGQLAVEMASNPPRLWVGVPTSIDPTGRKQITGGGKAWRTGDIKLTYKTVAPPNWIMCNDETIGDVGSGASYQNTNSNALFVLLFDNLTDTLAPLLTSAGATTSRANLVSGASAWVMHCRMTLPRMLGRALAVAGQGAGLSVQSLGDWNGAETVALNVAQLPNHAHILPPGPIYQYAESYVGTWPANAWGVNSSTGWAAGGSASHANNQPTTWLNAIIRL